MRVAVIYDFSGWAWWHRANNIRKNMPNDIEVVPYQAAEKFNVDEYDFVLTFSYHPLSELPEIPKEKLVLGISDCSNKSFSVISGMLSEDQCRAVVANNVINYERLLEFGMPVFLCQNGVDDEFFHPCPEERPERPTACWVGNPKSLGEKGLDLIEEACSQAGVNFIHHACFPPRAKLGDIIGQDSIRNDIYWKANFYICASLIEGTPNPALEAMACGLPVLSTRVGNMTEIIREGYNGYFVERNTNSIRQAMEKLTSDSIKTMGLNARHTIGDHWTWKHQARKYVQMFRLLA